MVKIDYNAANGKILLEIERLKEKEEERKRELPMKVVTDVLKIEKNIENTIKSYEKDIETFEKFKSESENEDMKNFFDNLIKSRQELLKRVKPLTPEKKKEIIYSLIEKHFYIDYHVLKIMENKIELYRKLRKKYILWSKISKKNYKDDIFECDFQISKKTRDRDSFVATCENLRGLYFYEKFFEK